MSAAGRDNRRGARAFWGEAEAPKAPVPSFDILFSGLHFSVSVQTLEQMVADPALLEAKIMYDASGRSTGQAVVRFSSEGTADQIMQECTTFFLLAFNVRGRQRYQGIEYILCAAHLHEAAFCR